MIPALDDYGNLPAGIHRATLEELVAAFGSGSPEREVQASELVEFVQWAITAGIRRIIVNGSFVTGKLSPNDVDVIVLPGPEYPMDTMDNEVIHDSVWPFLQIIFAADDADLERWANEDFGTDRRQRPKGVVELIL
ncbi:MAG TPA: hypothetical protein VMP01_29790 [Pirellulaceae bacterium]|nr:hypothetical protein [Pirellulaceae bacterium]